jgi:hypothetical protein
MSIKSESVEAANGDTFFGRAPISFHLAQSRDDFRVLEIQLRRRRRQDFPDSCKIHSAFAHAT